ESLKIINLAKKNQNIKYLGRVDDDKLIELYSNAVCFVYPSLYEGFGIPPLEAQACGCPIVISDIPVFKEVYANSALFFNPYDPEDMAKKIENIIDSSNMRKELIQKGFKNVKKYTWENSARQFFNILNKVIKND
ncbi:TPA: glycosyltransferase family 1 protein, partial [bacterium]|nr:glycosyltransferase family 1 protein [bacterium]